MGKRIAIITARGGSKRIPKKNIREFLGKPILAYSIEAALGSGLFDEVMVSTDSEEIAEVARQYGASVPFMRSQRTSNDFAITHDVLEEVIFEYKKRGKEFSELCCIYPCVPFLKPSSLKSAYELMKSKGANSVMPVCRYPAPVEWAMRINDDVLFADDVEKQLIRSQDLKPAYFDAGMFYFYRTEIFMQERTTLFPNTIGYVIDESECQDIDTPDDWKMAEMKRARARMS